MVPDSDKDLADALPPPRLERTRAASRTTSPPPSPTAPAPATTIEAARAAAELISSQPLSTGDANDTGDGDATHGNGCDEEKDQGGEVSVGQDPRRVSDIANVSAARPPLPP